MSPHKPGPLGPLLLGSSILLSAAGQLGMKAGMQTLADSGAHAATQLAALAPVIEWTVGGLAAYGLSLIAWLAVLARYPLSYAYPLLGLSYVLVYAGATHWERLHETATPLRTAGTLLILLGAALVSRSGARPSRPS